MMSSTTSASRNCLFVSASALLLTMISFAPFASASTIGGGGLLVPLYIAPQVDSTGSCSSPAYIALATSASPVTNTIAIVNPANGPQITDKTAYNTCITYLQSNGVEVVGYVHTKVGYPNIYGYRPVEDVKTDIDEWMTSYDVDGIFVDEVSNRWLNTEWDSVETVVQFNQDLMDYTLNHHGYGRVILNPGSPYFEGILGSTYYGDARVIVVVFEQTQSSYQPTTDECIDQLWTDAQGQFAEGPWCRFVPNWDGIEPLKTLMDNGTILPEQSAVMVYGAAADAAATARTIHYGNKDSIGWFYVTDSVTPWSESPDPTVLTAQAVGVLMHQL